MHEICNITRPCQRPSQNLPTTSQEKRVRRVPHTHYSERTGKMRTFGGLPPCISTFGHAARDVQQVRRWEPFPSRFCAVTPVTKTFPVDAITK